MIKSLPTAERPRERLEYQGSDAVSTVELLAIILSSGTQGISVLQLAQQLLKQFGSLSQIAEATISDLCLIKGIGHAKAIQLKAALTLATRLAKEQIPQKSQLQTAKAAYEWVKVYYENERQEKLGVILQDAKGCAIRFEVISLGTLYQTLVHPREVFAPAIRYAAASLILVHNHPSGDPTPSEQDFEQTRRILRASRLMDIPLNDHIILTPSRFVSMRTLIPFQS